MASAVAVAVADTAIAVGGDSEEKSHHPMNGEENCYSPLDGESGAGDGDFH